MADRALAPNARRDVRTPDTNTRNFAIIRHQDLGLVRRSPNKRAPGRGIPFPDLPCEHVTLTLLDCYACGAYFHF